MSSCVLELAIILPSAATTLTLSARRPLAVAGSSRRKPRISSGLRLHSVSPKGRPAEKLVPSGRPRMVMMLRGGRFSLLSSDMAKAVSLPASPTMEAGALSVTGGSSMSRLARIVSDAGGAATAACCTT